MSVDTEHQEDARRLRRRTVSFGLGILLSRVTGLLREVLLSRSLGTSPAASAIVVAQVFPSLLRGLFADDVAQGALAPVLGRHHSRSAQRAVVQITRWSAVASTVLAVALALVALPSTGVLIGVAGPGLDAGTSLMAEHFLRLLLPVVAVSGLAASGSALLVVRGRVGTIAVLNTVSNLPMVLGLIFLTPSADGITKLLTAGLVLQAIGLFLTSGALSLRADLESDEAMPREEVRREGWSAARLALPVALSLGAANLSGVVDVAFASAISSAAPAALDKAFRLMLLPYGILGLAVTVAAVPALVAAADGTDHDYQLHLRRAVKLQVLLLLPAAAFLLALAEPIVRLVYQRGAFDEGSVQIVTHAVRGSAPLLIALGLSALGTRAWTVRRRPWLPAAAGVVGVAFNAGFDALLVGPLGVAGIALATALVHGALGGFLLVRAGLLNQGISPGRVLRSMAPGLLGGAFVLPLVAGPSQVDRPLAAVGLGAVAIALGTLTGARLFRVDEYLDFLRIRRGRAAA